MTNKKTAQTPAPKRSSGSRAAKKKTASPAPSRKEGRNPDGTFAPGHALVGGIQKGTKHMLSLRVQNAIMSIVADEMETERFTRGLATLALTDLKGYYQVLAAFAKYATPTLNNHDLELSAGEGNKTIDELLDELMNKRITEK